MIVYMCVILCSLCCSVGYFIQPTIIQTTNPKSKLMQEVSEEQGNTSYMYVTSLVPRLICGLGTRLVYNQTVLDRKKALGLLWTEL